MGYSDAIYGIDSNSFAEGVSRKSLSQGRGTEDIWGDAQDDRAQAKANVGAESSGPSNPKTPILRGVANKAASNKGRGDVENITSPYPQLGRFPRHVKGPSKSEDNGGGKTSPPPRNQTTNKKGGSPKP